jgi:hypothetical protein
MSSRPYIHGTSEREQRRLVEQADLLGDLLADLLADNLELNLGERLPEIGCGVGGARPSGRPRRHSPKPDQEGDLISLELIISRALSANGAPSLILSMRISERPEETCSPLPIGNSTEPLSMLA